MEKFSLNNTVEEAIDMIVKAIVNTYCMPVKIIRTETYHIIRNVLLLKTIKGA